MKTYKFLFSFLITVLFISISSNLTAQISDNFTLQQSNIVFNQNGNYDIMSITDCSFTCEVGNPQLPMFTETFVLPYNAVVTDIQVNTTNIQQIAGSYYIFPAQPPQILDGSATPPFAEPNPAVYNSINPYPNKTVEIVENGHLHGYHIVTVAIYPISYIPANSEIYLRSYNYTINYTISNNNNNQIVKQSIARAELTKQFVKGFVKNKNDVESFKNSNIKIIPYTNNLNRISNNNQQKSTTLTSKVELVPDYIIVTNEELKPTFQILADWKTKKGVPTIIKTVEEIEPNYAGSDLQEKIRNYLKEAYSKWGEGLFVLLGGDVNVIPARLYQNIGFPTDLYYATFSGTWNANKNHIFGESSDNTDYNYDFFLGRASVENTIEAQIFVNKVINYEKFSNISNNDYVNNFLCMVGFLNSDECNGATIYSRSFSNELINISNTFPSNIQKYFLFDNHNCNMTNLNYSNSSNLNSNEIYAAYHNPDTTYSLGYTTLPCGNINKNLVGNYFCNNGDEELDRTNALACLNNGGSSGLGHFHLVYHVDHSNIKSIGVSSKYKYQSITNSDLDQLNNGNYHQILFTNGCDPGVFTKDCIGEHYINNPVGGGVAFIGDADAGYYSDIEKQFPHFCYALYDNTTPYNMGFAFQNAAYPYYSGLYYEGGYISQKRRLHLLGDPEMPVWTNTPQTLAVTKSSSVNSNGKYTITVTLNTPLAIGDSALICLQKGNEGYATKKVPSQGSETFYFTPNTSGNVDITVTAHNYKPYETTIPVTANKNIYIFNKTFYDGASTNSTGNSDQQLDAGETVELAINLKNNNTTTVTNVQAVLSCDTTYITMLTNSINYGTINAGAIKTSTIKYRFKIKENTPEILLNELNPVKFMLQITSGTNTYSDSFGIEIFAPKLEQANKSIAAISGSDSIINVGDTVSIYIDLFNRGKAQATGTMATLTTENQNITIIDSISSYSAIGKFETKTNTAVYRFIAPQNYTTGTPLNFILTVENQFGKTWNFAFNLLDKPPQITSTSIDFTADRTEIDLFWTAIANNTSGYNIYRCNAGAGDTEILPYVKLNTFPLPAAFYNDLGLAELTKYYYKISAVSTSGNEGELSAPFLAWTAYSQKDGFPVNMYDNGDILGSINVEDIDADGNKEIFTSMKITYKNGLLIGLRHDGTELFDIDGNVTTFSGLAKDSAALQCTPAIGDIDGDGIYEIISMTRDESGSSGGEHNYFNGHKLQDTNTDGKPDLLFRYPAGRCYRAPILADLDNNGSLESIFYQEWGGIKIYNAAGTQIASIISSGTYGALAVADIDGDSNGYKEIIGCFLGNSTVSTGIYVWKYNGINWVNYVANQPFYTLSGHTFGSSAIVCDLDNDGDKEILTVAVNGTTARIVAIHHDGTAVTNWNNLNGSQSFTCSNEVPYPDISVGDLNNDGNLEVVALGTNIVKVWDKSGNLISSTAIDNLLHGKLTPILADVDSDTDIEIIFGTKNDSKGLINAIKMDGSKALGFPLRIENPLVGSPCVADIDNNGTNELIAASGNTIYVWETAGDAAMTEWGSERHNCRNTGEYIKNCSDVIISQNTTWTTNKTPCGNITIENGATLIIQNADLRLREAAIIFVRPGAKLIVDGSKITSACEGKFWNWICVMGDRTQRQLPQYQGIVELKNGAIVENAKTAISTSLSAEIYDNWNYNGGIIQATNTTFRNNVRSIEFLAYENHNSSGQIINNVSYFKDCNFIVNNDFYNNTANSASNQVTMWNVKGVTFNHCNFINTSNSTVAKGIYTIDAGFNVRDNCSPTFNSGCMVCQNAVEPSSFNGFEYAMETDNTGTQHSILVGNTNFNNNIYGVAISSLNNYKLLNNNLLGVNCGFLLSNTSGYKVEGNKIISSNQNITYGLAVYNSGISNNLIYRNEFENFLVGSLALDINGENTTTGTGLEFHCNKYTNCIYDIAFDVPIKSWQGSNSKGADNKFINTSSNSIFPFSNSQQITYFHSPNSNHALINPTAQNVAVVSNAATNACGQTICTSTILPPSEKLILFSELQNNYDNTLNNYKSNNYDVVLQQVDNGNSTIPTELANRARNARNMLQEISAQMTELSNNSIYEILTDTILDTDLLKIWYEIINTPIAKYSLAETHYMLAGYEQANSVLANIPQQFGFKENELVEHQNYMQFHAIKNVLANENRNWTQLTQNEINNLRQIRETTSSRSSSMANGVLCFFFGDCRETEFPAIDNNPQTKSAKQENLIDNTLLSFDNQIYIYPNPANDFVDIINLNLDTKINYIELTTVEGKVLKTQSELKLYIKNLQSGVYLIKIYFENGEIIVKKVVIQ